MDHWRLLAFCNNHNTAEPDAALEILVDVFEVGTEVDAVAGGNFVLVYAAGWWGEIE